MTAIGQNTTMRIGILQPGTTPKELTETYGSFADMCEQMLSPHGNFCFQIYNVFDGELPALANECDGWLITGSKFSVYDPLPWIAPLETLIQQIVDAKLPLGGICFGHQIIAEALGGKVVKSEKGWGLGPDRLSA